MIVALPLRGAIENSTWLHVMYYCGYKSEDIKELWHLPRLDTVARKKDLSENETKLVELLENPDMDFSDALDTNPDYIECVKKIDRVILCLMSAHYGYMFIPASPTRGPYVSNIRTRFEIRN